MGFDEQAIHWDKDIKKVKRAQTVATEIRKAIDTRHDLSALEFGCGTGLLSFELQNTFKSITLVDSSQGMIDVLKEKIKAAGQDHFHPVHADLMSDRADPGKYDVLYTLMTLHHISDLENALQVFDSLLEDNGYLCIADLVEEDGSFHDFEYERYAHNGFNKEHLSHLLTKHHFTVVYYNVCFEVEKETAHGLKKYPLFLMVGQKCRD